MALTTAQLEEIRLLSGDDCTPYLVSDTLLNSWYDEFGTYDCVIARVMQSRVAKAANAAGVDYEGRNTENPQLSGLERQAAYWVTRCGYLSSSVTVGSINLGIDEESSGFSNT